MEKINLHVTQLTRLMMCAYERKYESTDYLDPSITYPWDMLNIAVLSKSDPKPFLDYYIKHMNGDFKLAQVSKKVFSDAKELISLTNETYDIVYQEAKMVYKYNDDINIVGSPDLQFYDKKIDERFMRDLKFSKHSYYGKKEIWEYDAQPYIYPLMMMEYHNIEKEEVNAWFRCFDKNTWNMKEFDKPVTKKECLEYLDTVMGIYIEWMEMDIWESPVCHSFSHKRWWCPSKRWWVSEVEEISMGENDLWF